MEEEAKMELTPLSLEQLERRQCIIDRSPFETLRIDDSSILDTIDGREICGTCFKSRKFFCYTCCSHVIDDKYFPQVKLPIKIDIIKHPKEIDGKSTAIHAALLAPRDVTIYVYPEFPEFSPEDRVILIFPGKNAKSIQDLFTSHQHSNNNSGNNSDLPITRAVFIDSTWHQTKSIYKDPRLRNLPCVSFKSRISQFWRHQKKSPRWYLATVEALHQFLVEFHIAAYGKIENYVLMEADFSRKEYCGQYDNLLYLFKYMYNKIHTYYDHDELRAYKRPII